ncbi:hypothetical protein MCEMAEM21_02711 [Oxalobacteraceae bacterium]|mgnify:CR=1 FL=1|jgi:hypothetical protein
MTPQAALVDLLARVGASEDAAALLSNHALNQWPEVAVAALKTQRLLVKAQPASSAICPGCERDCVMPVQTRIHLSRGAVSYIDCDKRSDVSRVAVQVDRLEQWRCTADAVGDFVAASLGLRQSDKRRAASADFLEIGIATGDKRSQMLCLQTGGELILVAGGNTVPLADLIAYRSGAYSLDSARVVKLVDAASTADNRYTPSNAKREARKVDTQAMYKGWQKAYRALLKKSPGKSDVWYSQQIAKADKVHVRDPNTIKKHMKS